MGSDLSGGIVLPPGTGMQPPLKREFVDAARFRELAISNRNLLRSDDAVEEIRGLHDPVAGVVYVIAEETLFGEEPA